MSLATLAELKDRLEITTDTEDSYLTEVLGRATAKLNAICDRNLEVATHTEYVSGGGLYLFLREGPIRTVGSVSEVGYSAAGAESYTTRTEGADFHIWGKRTDGWKMEGYIEHVGADWPSGARNHRVVYSAGWDSNVTDEVPKDLVEACLHAAVWMRNKRRDVGMNDRTVGSSTKGLRNESELDKDLRGMLRPYISIGY